MTDFFLRVDLGAEVEVEVVEGLEVDERFWVEFSGGGWRRRRVRIVCGGGRG